MDLAREIERTKRAVERAEQRLRVGNGANTGDWAAPTRKRQWAKAYLDEFMALQMPPAIRLLYVLRRRSFGGKRALVLGTDLAAEAGIDPRRRSLYARKLEQLGLLKVEKAGQKTLRVRVR